MNIKRTSYFTFLVAITTLATVTSCSKVKGQSAPGNHIVAEEIFLDTNQLFNICLEGLSQTETQFELAKVLKDKGLKAGKFKLAIDPSGTLSVYLVIDKDYKGPVSAKIFAGDYQQQYGRMAVLTRDEPDNSTFSEYRSDKRDDISSKNRILRI
jgi:hypothetical protein